MKYDSFADKEYFMYGAAFAGKKTTFTGEDKAWYKKNTANAEQVSSAALVTTTGVAITQITSGAEEGPATPVTGISTIGNQAAALAEDWANREIPYSSNYRNAANYLDNASFISRIYHSVIPNDTTYATGETGYDKACTTSLDLWMLIDTFISQHTIVAANCCPVGILCPGDVIVYSENKTNVIYFYATSCGIYLGNNKIAKASNSARKTVIEALDIDKVVLVTRPNLNVIHEYGLTPPSSKVGCNLVTMAGITYGIPVFADNYYAYCPVSIDADD